MRRQIVKQPLPGELFAYAYVVVQWDEVLCVVHASMALALSAHILGCM